MKIVRLVGIDSEKKMLARLPGQRRVSCLCERSKRVVLVGLYVPSLCYRL